MDAGPLEDLSWLRALPPKNPSVLSGLEGDPTPVRAFDIAGLDALGMSVGGAFGALAAEPHLAAAVRSPTSCYLDLADTVVVLDDDGVLVHVLSDQQWGRHWLLHVDEGGEGAVVTTDEPLGFVLDEGEPAASLDGIEVCAPSFAEFLYRIWIEGELFWSGGRGPLPEPFDSYARHCRVRAAQPPSDPQW